MALIASFVTLDRIHSPGEALAGTLLNLIAMSAAYAVSYAFRRLQGEQARTRAALEELRAAREGQLEAARTEERARLAREIHDVLAHTLSALAVQVEGAKLMLETHADEPRALQSLDRAHRLAQEGLQEVRRAVGALRGDSLPGPEALRPGPQLRSRQWPRLPAGGRGSAGAPRPRGGPGHLPDRPGGAHQRAPSRRRLRGRPPPRLPGRGQRRAGGGGSRAPQGSRVVGRVRLTRHPGARRAPGRQPGGGTRRGRLPGQAASAGGAGRGGARVNGPWMPR
ncbi:MAG TPA: hypothetical protein DCX12_02820 [Chloroflexi bacterium]|nr:hypothetical protein [Chloroflexota bacterium]